MSPSAFRSRETRIILLDCLLAFFLSAALLWPLFRLGFADNWGSIESTFIADGRFLKDHWPHPQWQPLWYGGTRFDYIYPPALRYGTAAISKILNVETVRGYHIYTALFFAAGIAGVFLLARLGAGSRAAGWLAALATMLLSPSYLLLPHIRADGFHAAPWRLRVLATYGEGPHMTALAVLGFALIAAFYALRDGKPALLGLAAALSALVVSNNFYGATALAMFFPVLCWALWITHREKRVWLRAAAIAALAYGLTAVWLTPSYLRVTLENMKLVSKAGHPWSVAVAVAAVAAFVWATLRFAHGKRAMAYPVFVSGSLVFFALNVLGNQYFDFRIMGEPGRLIPELDLVIVLAAVEVLRRMWAGRLTRLAALFILALALFSSRHYVRHAWDLWRPDPDYRNRVEYRIPHWMAANMPEARALVTGSVRFWYNTWHDLPQAGGGSEQGILNQTVLAGMWQIMLGDTAEPGVLWMQAIGVDAIVTHGPRSSEIYHDIKHPQRFAGVLPVAFDDGQDNVIYKVPRRYLGLARVVDRDKLMARPEFREGMDQLSNLRPYVALVENGPDSPAAFKWESTGAMRIHARVRDGESVLVQVAYDPAWRAYSRGRPLPVRKDPFGQMLVQTPPGEHDIRLVFETPLENSAGGLLTVLSLLIVAGLTVFGERAASPFRRLLSRARLTAPAAYLPVLCAVNVYIHQGLFLRPFVEHMNSMHGEWIALARLGDWFSLKPLWWPFWGGGVPLEHTYAPLLPVAIGAGSTFLNLPHGQVLFLIAGLVSCAVAAALFLLAWRMTKAPGAAFVAALAYSLLSPTELLIPDVAFRWSGLLSGRRQYVSIIWDDLPHLTALALLPLLVLAFRRYLGGRRLRWAFASGAILAVMMSVTMFGWTMAAVAMLCVILAEPARRGRAALSAALMAIAAYLVVCPAFPPSLLATIRGNAVLDGEVQPGLRAAAAALIVAAGIALLCWAAARRRWPRELTFAVLFAWIVCSIPLLYAYARMHFIPQPGRYKFEMEMAIALLVAFALAYVARRFPRAFRLAPAVVLLLALPQIRHLRVFVDGMFQALLVERTIEYRAAQWAEQNLPGQRVMMGGSLGQWLNAFTDVPQLSAQPYTTTPNWIQQGVLYNVYAAAGDRAGEMSATWLKAFGVRAVSVSGPDSTEYWKAYRDPRKFEGLLPVLWRQDDTTIYAVTQRSASLAHVVPREKLVRNHPFYAIPELESYVKALEDPSAPDLHLTCNPAERCSARVAMSPGQALSVQINYHPGWRARVNGREVPVHHDALGLMYVVPEHSGLCDIELTYEGSLEYKLCRIVSPLALLGICVFALARKRARA